MIFYYFFFGLIFNAPCVGWLNDEIAGAIAWLLFRVNIIMQKVSK